MRYIVANWKAHKNLAETQDWIETFIGLLKKDAKTSAKLRDKKITIIICPSHHLIYPTKQQLKEIPNLFIGAQDVSFFEKGSYTGEVPAQNIRELVDFVILGHSERRKYFKETNNVIDQKTILALEHGLKPIVCARNPQDLVPQGVEFVAYEPVFAIGTGENESLDEVLRMKRSLHLDPSTKFLYGGSVDEKNITSYASSEIGGFLVGTASKDPHAFYKMTTLL